MRAANLILLAVLCGSSMVVAQDNVQTRIPDHLLECYKNLTLNHREFRPPMTIQTFIELVRKVEDYPGTNMDIRVLSTTLLHRFRLDGIEQNSEVMTSSGVIPFSVKGYQFFKHRILMRSFMQGNSERFQNESLSAVEQCTMHFLLSNSIDKGQRGDEGTVCNQVQNYRRRPRSASDDLVLEVDELQNYRTTPRGATPEEVAVPVVAALEGLPDGDAEVIDVKNLNAAAADEKGNMFLDDDYSGRLSAQSPSPLPSPRPPRRGPAPIPQSSSGVNPRNTQGTGYNPRSSQPDSECPVENGVVTTPYGSVTLGTLLAGVAAGLQPMTVASRMLNPKIVDSVDVENIWAATLAGDLAELVLLQGPRYGTNLKLGPSGGWNSTILPRWYFIKEALDNQITDAEMRGGLDGLVIGKYIQEWNSRAGNRLKLSQVLDMYYSERGVYSNQQYRACARRDRYNDVADKQTIEQQTDGFATILDPQMISEAYLDEDKILEFSKEAANRINNYIPSNLDTQPCSSVGRDSNTGSPSPVVAVEVYVVVDTTWQYRDVQPLFMSMMTKLDMGVYGSNLTVITGKERKTLLNGTKSFVEFAANFTEAAYSQNVYGMDLPGVLRSLKNEFRFQQQMERSRNMAGGGSKVVLIMPGPGHNMGESDATIARDTFQYLHEYVPDVKFLYLTQGNKDRYQDLVEDSTKDIFEMRIGSDESSVDMTLDPVISRMKQVHHRIINPTCGSGWVSKSYSSAQYTAFVEPGSIAYYRLHQNYLFAAGWGKVKVQGFGYGSLKVCQSRRANYPGNSTGSNSGTTCKEINGDTWDITFDKPCSGYDYVNQCPPYYISVEATVAATGGQPRCMENGCRNPDTVKYALINEGLTCTAGIGRFLGSPALVTALFVLVAALRSALQGC